MATRPSLNQIRDAQHVFDTVAEMEAAKFLKTGDKVKTLGYTTVGDGGGNDYEIGSGFGTADNGSVFDLPGSGLQARGLFVDGVIDARQFGGTTADVSTALQEYMDGAGSLVQLRGGDFHISLGLTSSVAGRTIRMDGARLVCKTQDMTALTITGDETELIVNIDGDGVGAIGADIAAGGCTVRDSIIENLYGDVIGSAGVRATTTEGVTVIDNWFSTISANPNATIGDNPGSARAVLVTAATDAIRQTTIAGNEIYEITGEEGDAIQLLFFDGLQPYNESFSTVENNKIFNANRRAIKVQASGAVVMGNVIENNLTTVQHPNLIQQIDIIASNNCSVKGNDITTSEAGGIFCSGAGFTPSGNHINGNILRIGSGQAAIFVDDQILPTVSRNEIDGGANGILAQDTSGGIFSRNSFTGGVITGDAIQFNATCDNLTIEHNVVLSGTRLTGIDLRAPNCIVRHNHSEIGVCITSTGSAAGSVFENNTNRSDTDATLSGNFSGQISGGNFNLGAGGTGTDATRGKTFWSKAIPSTEYPLFSFNVGDIAFNSVATAGGKVGWVCVTGGTPGTWKAFGVIDA